MVAIPTENSIREAAYYKWLDAGKPTGQDLQFWLEAEQDLTLDSAESPAFYADEVDEQLQESFPASDAATWMMTSVGVHPTGFSTSSE